jgi:hypothetical protein
MTVHRLRSSTFLNALGAFHHITVGKHQRVLANFDVQDLPSEIVLEAVA